MRARWFPLPLPMLAACQPDPATPDFVVDRERVVAVIAEPAEAAPGDFIELSALVVSPDGTVREPELDWTLCRAPKPLGENNTVSPACLRETGSPLGRGATVTARIPTDACSLFGPETPPGSFRPRDPDATGGFYQPVHLVLGSETAVALIRLTCRPANAPLATVLELELRRTDNENPAGLMIHASDAGENQPGPLTLTASFTADSAEPYPLIDPESQIVVEARENLTLSWYTSSGALDETRTRVKAGETAVENRLLPSQVRPAHVWAVLRDGRGGAVHARITLE